MSSIYTVWRRPGHPCYRIWMPQHFAADVPEPAEDDPDVVYRGNDYAAATAAASAANEKMGTWNTSSPRTAMKPQRDEPEPKAPETPETLFG